MSTILMHPTLLRDPIAMAQLQIETGIRIDANGKKTPHVQLVASKQADHLVSPCKPMNYGGFIWLQCTHCATQSNMHLRGEVCTRCNKGTMIDPWTGGGNAA
jgi:hypothetical protein